MPRRGRGTDRMTLDVATKEIASPFAARFASQTRSPAWTFATVGRSPGSMRGTASSTSTATIRRGTPRLLLQALTRTDMP